MGYPGIGTGRPEPDGPSDVNIVLLGRTGAGKSASGNTILGQNAFESKFGAKSRTKECKEMTALVSGRRVTVLDTPGLYDTRHGMEKFETERPKLEEFSRRGRCVFLMVIELGRFTEEEEKSIEKMLESFAYEPLSKFLILFTNGDRLEGQPIEEFLEEADDNLQDLLKRFRYHVFNNKSETDYEQVLQLLEKADGMLARRQVPGPDIELMIQDFLNSQTHEGEDDGTTQEPLRLVLLGKAGTGKSASGNTILGRYGFESESGVSSVTRECRSAEGMACGRKVVVVDTPGFFGNSGSKEQIAEEVVKSVCLSAPGPHAFLLVVSLNERLTTEAKDTIRELRRNFGDDFEKYTIILFSHLDKLGREVEDLIRSDPELDELLRPFESRIHAFDNSNRRNRGQVRKLLEKIDGMVTHNGGWYTDEMYRVAEEAVTREAERLFRESEYEIRRRIELQRQDEDRGGQDGNRGRHVRNRGGQVRNRGGQDGNIAEQGGNRAEQGDNRAEQGDNRAEQGDNGAEQGGNGAGQGGGNSCRDSIKSFFVNAFKAMIRAIKYFFAPIIAELHSSFFQSNSGKSNYVMLMPLLSDNS